MKIAPLGAEAPAKQHEAGECRGRNLASIAQVDDDRARPQIEQHLPRDSAGFIVGQSFLFGND